GHGISSMFFEMLPYIEHQNVTQLFDAKNPSTYYDAKAGAAKTEIKLFVSANDPSVEGDASTTIEIIDPTAKDPFAKKFTGTYATTSYAANGLVFTPGGRQITDINDGTSQTFSFAERYRVCKKSEKKEDAVYNLWGLGAFGASTPGFAVQIP